MLSERKQVSTIRPVVIIPTYNNERTIAEVIDAVKKHCSDIIVVNDGSTDSTINILQNTDGIYLVDYAVNKGKGIALQEGFKVANSKGYTHAITFDADGQHLAIDIPLMLKKIVEEPGTLWIGDRIITVKDGVEQPPRSRFGRRFGAFWFRFYTGKYIRDTQCGFRVYPLAEINKLECTSPRYEYEIEILISAAWNDIPVKSVSIHLLYHLPDERVSHFRPVRDFLRISRINSKAALVRIFLPAQVRKTGGLSLREKLKVFIINELKSNADPRSAAASLGYGAFIGITPLHGIQVLLVIASSFVFKLNRPLALLGVSISSAPLLPIWIAAGLGVGKLCISEKWALPLVNFLKRVASMGIFSSLKLPVEDFATGFVQWFFGSFIMAAICGTAIYFVTLPVCKKMASTWK